MNFFPTNLQNKHSFKIYVYLLNKSYALIALMVSLIFVARTEMEPYFPNILNLKNHNLIPVSALNIKGNVM